MDDNVRNDRSSGRHRSILAYGLVGIVFVAILAAAGLAYMIGSSPARQAKAYERMVAAQERQAQIPAVVMATEAEARAAAAVADQTALLAPQIAAGQAARASVWGWLGIVFAIVLVGLLVMLVWQYGKYRQALLRRMAQVPDVKTDGNLTIITPPNGEPMLAYQHLPAIAAPQTNGLQLIVPDAAVVHAVTHAQAAQAAAQFAITQGQRPAFLERGD